MATFNLKSIKDLNKRTEIVKFPKKNIGKMFLNIWLGNNFLDMTSKHTNNKKSKQEGLHKQNTFCTAKEIINKK